MLEKWGPWGAMTGFVISHFFLLISAVAIVFAAYHADRIIDLMHGEKQPLIEFGEGVGGCRNERQQQGKLSNVFLRIKILNNTGRILRNCRCDITEIKTKNGSENYVDILHDKIQLPFASAPDGEDKCVAIPDGDSEYVPFVEFVRVSFSNRPDENGFRIYPLHFKFIGPDLSPEKWAS